MSISAFGIEHGEFSKDLSEQRKKQHSVGGIAALGGAAGAYGLGSTGGERAVKVANQAIKQHRGAGKKLTGLNAGAFRTGSYIGGTAGKLMHKPGLTAGVVGGSALAAGAVQHAANSRNRRLGRS